MFLVSILYLFLIDVLAWPVNVLRKYLKVLQASLAKKLFRLLF